VRAAIFFDRDGVVNELVPDAASGLPESPLAPELVKLIPGAADGLRRLRDAGFLLVGTSNQPAAAKGVVSLERLRRVHERVLELLEGAGAAPDAFRICYHHPAGVVPELAQACACRKPSPGMLHDAAAALELELTASWMIGDSDSDIAAGSTAGCRTILVENPSSAHRRGGAVEPDARVRDLPAAADVVVVAPAS
jgi:D-glycero-D-manno-heptose 1,7-bisphosphate phosphatase